MHDSRQLTTLALLQLQVAICKQLNTAPYLGGEHSISLGHYCTTGESRDRASCTLRWSTRRFHVCTSLAPRPMTVVFDLGTRLRVRMRTTFENGVLRNGQPAQPGSAVNSFIDQGEFGAMKTLSGRIGPRCDKHQFCDKMKVSTWTVFELSLFEQSGRNKERKKTKNGTFATAHFCV